MGVDYRQPTTDMDSFTLCDLRSPSDVDAMVAGLDGPIDRIAFGYTAHIDPQGTAITHAPVIVAQLDVVPARLRIRFMTAIGRGKDSPRDELGSNRDIENAIRGLRPFRPFGPCGPGS